MVYSLLRRLESRERVQEFFRDGFFSHGRNVLLILNDLRNCATILIDLEQLAKDFARVERVNRAVHSALLIINNLRASALDVYESVCLPLVDMLRAAAQVRVVRAGAIVFREWALPAVALSPRGDTVR
jgi:hypothetical protein